MDTGPFARFPLIARPRPVCGPLHNRVTDLTERAKLATATGNLAAASAVCNLAALIASDCGLPELARQWCLDHTNTYLRTPHRGTHVGRYTLEPLVNLARLQIRANDGEGAYHLLHSLFDAITTRLDTEVDGLVIPADLIVGDDERRTVRRWLWTVLLSDGTRALTSIGKWTDAYQRLLTYNGVGDLMLDGRQVAVIAHATAGDLATAQHLIDTTTAGEQPWLDAVTACLAVLCQENPSTKLVTDMIHRYQHLPFAPDVAVFGTQLGLGVLDAIGGPNQPDARTTATRVIDHTIASGDGYAGRDLLAHRDLTAMLGHEQRRTLDEIYEASALNAKDIPPPLRHAIDAALTESQTVIAGAAASWVTGERRPGP
jgi:hypothetical protein